jgi:hypothetical protein
MDTGMVGMPGGPFGTLDACGAIRWMLEQFHALALDLATGAPIPVFRDEPFSRHVVT